MFRRAFGAVALAGYRSRARLRDKLFSLAVGGAFASFGRRSVLQLPVRLKGTRRIAIGSGCFVGAGSWLQTLGDGDEPALRIGDRASIAGACVLSAVASVRIGGGVSFARGVYVADHAHAYDGAAAVRDGALTDVAPVEIGDGVWLGANVVVLPGARIGERAVIGANSVVSGEIPPRSLALGSPARVVRRFDGA
jgi:lipopolysaccharide O-acetyltransferase